MDTTWFELRADYQKVAAYSYGNSGQTYNKAKELVFSLLDVTARGLYKDKVMQVVEVGGLQEKVIHEEHPTVMDMK